MRLIDADALDMAFTNLRFNQDMSLAHWGDRKDWCLHGNEVEKLIYDAPTVSCWISVKEVANIIADLFGDVCACNSNGIDEWLPQYCEYRDTDCPHPPGVACWEQYLKHLDKKPNGGG